MARPKFLHLTRRFEEGLRPLSEPLIYGPLPLEARGFLALMAAHQGDKERAKQLIESIRPDSAAQLPMMAGIAEVLALIGEREEANQIAAQFQDVVSGCGDQPVPAGAAFGSPGR